MIMSGTLSNISPRLHEVNVLHEPEANLATRHRPSERKPAYLLHGVLRVTDHQAARTRQTLGRRVPETLRHIQVLL